MKFEILIKQDNYPEDEGNPYWEKYEENIKDAQKWAEETIASFNASLRPSESPRTLLKVEISGDANNEELHDWDKDITQMSAMFRGKMYDGMFCTKCRITGKRFGLSPRVTVDSKYRKKVFQKCNTAKQELAKE